MKYKVTWTAIQEYEIEATVEADSEAEAIKKAEHGDTEDEDEQFMCGIETKDYKAELSEDQDEEHADADV